MRPDAEIAACRTAHESLFVTLDGIDEELLRRPSLLPDWMVGHVLVHLVGHADSVSRRLAGVLENRVVDQYSGGKAGRAADIEEVAALPRGELLAAVRETSGEVEAMLAAVPDDAWERESRSVSGAMVPAYKLAFSRVREVEVHHTDLGLGHPPSAWPLMIAEQSLPDLLAGLSARTDPRLLAAWAMGRAPAPELAPWD